MRRLRHLLAAFFRRGSRPEDIPRLLDAQTLSRAMDEARILHENHAVDVKPVGFGEIPLPRRAEDEPH